MIYEEGTQRSRLKTPRGMDYLQIVAMVNLVILSECNHGCCQNVAAI